MADLAAVPGAPVANTEPEILDSTSGPAVSTITPADAAAMMQKLGIPTPLRSELKQEDPAPEPEPEVAPAPEGEPAEGEPEAIAAEPDPEVAEPEQDEEKDDDKPPQTEGLSPAEAKLQKRNYKLRLRARRAEDKAAELEAKLAEQATAQPVQIQPSVANPLADVTTQEQLTAAKQHFKMLLRTAEDNPDGWVAHEGTPQQVVVDRDEARKWRDYARDVLEEHIPAKVKELSEIRPAAEQVARQTLPAMYTAGTAEYQQARALWKEEPLIATSPKRDLITALVIRGIQATAASQQASKEEKSKLEIPEKILKAHEQRDKVTVQKQTPPSRMAGLGVSKGPDLSKVMAQVQKSGGSMRSITEALNAFDKGSAKANGRELAPV